MRLAKLEVTGPLSKVIRRGDYVETRTGSNATAEALRRAASIEVDAKKAAADIIARATDDGNALLSGKIFETLETIEMLAEQAETRMLESMGEAVAGHFGETINELSVAKFTEYIVRQAQFNAQDMSEIEIRIAQEDHDASALPFPRIFNLVAVVPDPELPAGSMSCRIGDATMTIDKGDYVRYMAGKLKRMVTAGHA